MPLKLEDLLQASTIQENLKTAYIKTILNSLTLLKYTNFENFWETYQINVGRLSIHRFLLRMHSYIYKVPIYLFTHMSNCTNVSLITLYSTFVSRLINIKPKPCYQYLASTLTSSNIKLMSIVSSSNYNRSIEKNQIKICESSYMLFLPW